MKILKIELQNINSLKSECPIVIDFEAEQFKDIGLFAITGSTGAGKTTVLDAITIALYHQVPRFIKSNIKSGLEDIVSYGANDAFTSVLFENKGEIFEAFWSIRLASKLGKKLSKPIEEVRLKNLSTEKIIAEKKRDVQSEIEKVTQLNYNQFLRSVMLAQGEFAAFLSADSKDKATLLEQITGEDIYKRIGEIISRRKSEEIKKLEAVNSKVNNDDILTDEQCSELKLEQEEIEHNLKELEKEFLLIKKANEWYLKNKDLESQQEKIQLQLLELENNRKDKQDIFKRLELNEKAEPFKDLLNSIDRIETENNAKKNDLQKINSELELLLPKIEQTEVEELEANKLLKENDSVFKDWLPKLDKISILDTDLKNETEKKEIQKINLSEATKLIKAKNKDIKSQKKKKVKKIVELKKIASFLEKNRQIPELSKQLNILCTKLNDLKRCSLILNDDLDFRLKKETEIEKVALDLDSHNKDLEIEKAKQLKINNELSIINEQLKNNDFDQLLQEKENLEKQDSDWKAFNKLSVSYLEIIESKNISVEENNSLEKEHIILKKDLDEINISIEKSKISLNDQEIIVAQEKEIKKYEIDRQKLQSGKPCNLCGSKEHPYVEKYQKLEITKSEKELKKRKLNLAKLEKNKIKIDSNIIKTVTKLENTTQKIAEFNRKIKINQEEVNLFDLKIEISDRSLILANLDSIKENLIIVNEKIKLTKELQKQKIEQEDVLKTINDSFNKITIQIATLIEKEKNLNLELSEKKKEIKKQENAIKKNSDTLKKELSKYNLELPIVEGIDLFINGLEKNIAEYNSNEKELDNLQNNISEIDIKIDNVQEKLLEEQGSLDKLEKTIFETEKKYVDLLNQRTSILDININAETKRTELQSIKDNCHENYDLIRKKLQELKTNKTSQETLKNKIEHDLTLSNNDLEINNLNLANKLNESEFITKDEVKRLLLNKDDKVIFNNQKKLLDDRFTELNALNIELYNEKKSQDKQKDFEISETEVVIKNNEIKALKESLLKKLGEISEKFTSDSKIKNRNKVVYEEINQQEKQLKKWSDLLDLLGGSKHSFNTYVQRLTLQNLIGLANIHLYKLNNRYSLKMNDTYKKSEELNFSLIDHYQTDEARSVDTSSGGEKFIISLALALGLSDLSSNNVKVDSLFIDEGFGTLDNNTLETVISTLETLQAQGKMIGIISHVENLKERIPTQIQIIKKSNGVSKVKISS